MAKVARFYAQYYNDTPIVNDRGWRVYDRMIHYGAGEPMEVCHCWTRDNAFNIRDLLNAQEVAKRKEK